VPSSRKKHSVKSILSTIKDINSKYPELKFSQILSCALDPKGLGIGLSTLEDNEMLELLKELESRLDQFKHPHPVE
jgi:hypothetical protein